ncbi:MAG: TetR/AcrR family transcriptional regulator [bacterium]
MRAPLEKDAERDAPIRRPGRPRLDEKDGLAVRERLIEAATTLAVEQGFEACGLREIAARAEVSPGMIAYYFGDREGLHEAMFQRAFERVTEQVRSLLEQQTSGRHEDETHDRLDELIRIHVMSLAADPWLPKLIARDVLSADDSPLRVRAAERLRSGPVPIIVRWIEEEQARGLLRSDLDPRLMAISIASLAVFPFLAIPLVGSRLGLELDDTGVLGLIEHNRKVLSQGIRALTEES